MSNEVANAPGAAARSSMLLAVCGVLMAQAGCDPLWDGKLADQKINYPDQGKDQGVADQNITKVPDQKVRDQKITKAPDQKARDQKITKVPDQKITVPDQGTKVPDQGTKVPDQKIKVPDQGTKLPDQVVPDQKIKVPDQGKDQQVSHDGGCLGGKPIAGYCLINGVICVKDGGRHPSKSCYQCNSTKNPYAWTAVPDPCTINGTCYVKGEQHKGMCAHCDPSISKTSWTVKGSACLINSVCYKPGHKGPKTCSACDPKQSKSAWSLPQGHCLIDGACLKDGAKHPKTSCSLCDAKTSTSAWTLAPGNCLIQGVCYKDGAQHPKMSCYRCDSKSNTSGWTIKPGVCQIDGACYSKGAKHPGQCALCNPSTSATRWTVPGSGHCLIDGVCRKAGDKDYAGCGVCTPATDRYGWTVPAGYCQIDDKCHKKGAKHLAGCGTCDPSKSNGTWTNGCSGYRAWTRVFGGSGDQGAFDVAADGKGNVYLSGWFDSSINFGGPTLNVKNGKSFLTSFTPGGKHRWTKQINAGRVNIDGAGNVYTGAGSSFTSSGKLRWTGAGIDGVDSAGNSYAMGLSWLTSVDTNGVHRWSSGNVGTYLAIAPTGTVVHVVGLHSGSKYTYAYWNRIDSATGALKGGNNYINLSWVGGVAAGGSDVYLWGTLSYPGWSCYYQIFKSPSSSTQPSVTYLCDTMTFQDVAADSTRLAYTGSFKWLYHKKKHKGKGDFFVSGPGWTDYFGGKEYESGAAVALDGQGSTIVAGTFCGLTSLGIPNGKCDIFLIKYHP